MPTRTSPKTPVDPVGSARAAGLLYTTDTKPGIRRRPTRTGFTYTTENGKALKDEGELQRIRSLAIPPAWTDVWICPDARGHLQATGRDARGRKQYRYHSKWREVRDETKYDRMIGFARALPAIRRRTSEDLRRTGLPREKVLATVVQLLEKTLIRVGNDAYAKQNRSFGLTTLRDGHVEVNGGTVRFTFRGKSGVEHDVDLEDRRLARIVKQCRDLPGYDLFQYVDSDRARQTIGSADVNAYLKEITGKDLTSKDFRTWAGTVLAAQMLRELREVDSAARAKKNIVQIVEAVAKRLGNTRAVCRKCYIHPAVLDAYLDGTMLRTVAQRARRIRRSAAGLSEGEAAVLDLLQRRLSRAPRGRAATATLSDSLRLSLRSQSAARRRSSAPRGGAGSTRSSRAAARSS
jgi:DNA topoisomerase-1